MRAFFLLSILAVGSFAQQPAPEEKSASKPFLRLPSKGNLSAYAGKPVKPSFAWAEPAKAENSPCSIPLVNVVPPSSNGTMIVIPVGPSPDAMPQAQMPAPACKDWPAR